MTDVTEMLFEGRRAVGVAHAERRVSGRCVVVNADFSRAMTRLVPDHLRRRWTDAKIARKRFSCSTFMLYLGIEGRYDHLDHHNIYIAKDYLRNLDEIENRHVLSEDPSFYVQNACITDPTLAPAGMSTLYVLVPVTHQHPNVDWNKERARFRAITLRQLSKVGIETPKSVSDTSGWSRLQCGKRILKYTAERHSTSRIISGKCCTCAPATASTNCRACISWAAAHIPEAVCPSYSSRR